MSEQAQNLNENEELVEEVQQEWKPQRIADNQ